MCGCGKKSHHHNKKRHHHKRRKSHIPQTPAERVFSRVRNATVTLTAITDDEGSVATGSGFILSKDGIIATACHVVGTGPNGIYQNVYATITNYNGTGKTHTVECDVIGVDGSGDIGVVKVKPEYNLTNQRYVKWGNSKRAQVGDTCYVIGDPLALDIQSLSSGIIRDPKYVTTEGVNVLEAIYVTVPGFSGNSGSPMFDANGDVIGIYTFGPTMPVVDEEGNKIGDVGAETLGGGPTQRMAQFVVEKIVEIQDNYCTYRGQLGISGVPPLSNVSIVQYPLLLGTEFDMRGQFASAYLDDTLPDAGLPENALITEVNGQVCGMILGQSSLTTRYWHLPKGSTVTVKYIDPTAGTEEQTVQVVLGEVNPDEDTPVSGNC
jgi:S1-C subfamily serine protease